ncbi:MAG: putative sugar nucleotidyl transferase, partial [bacterium]
MFDTICIFEDSHFAKLYPLTLTRPVFDLRCGLTTLKGKITRQFPQSSVSFLCRDDLAEVLQEQNPEAKVNRVDAERCFFINGRVLFNSQFVKLLETRQERLYLHKGQLVAAHLGGATLKEMLTISEGKFEPKELPDVERV